MRIYHLPNSGCQARLRDGSRGCRHRWKVYELRRGHERKRVCGTHLYAAIRAGWKSCS